MKKLVSVSLRSIIHSYYRILKRLSLFIKKSFRLLTEYHSFLLKELSSNIKASMNSFRLLTEYHSFL